MGAGRASQPHHPSHHPVTLRRPDADPRWPDVSGAGLRGRPPVWPPRPPGPALDHDFADAESLVGRPHVIAWHGRDSKTSLVTEEVQREPPSQPGGGVHWTAAQPGERPMLR